MDKNNKNICKKVLLAGQKTCDVEDLLNKSIAWCKKLNLRYVTKGTDPILAGAKSDQFKLNKGVMGRERQRTKSSPE